MRKLLFLLLVPLISLGFTMPTGTRYFVQSGEVRFKSDAPLEVIEAKSKLLKGVIDMEERTFAFSVGHLQLRGLQQPAATGAFQRKLHGKPKVQVSDFFGKNH